jgi:Skp family chaperone for outer membrane proteins
MRFDRTTASIALLLALFLTASARAQTAVAKVAIANPVRIFNDIQETQDLKAKMQSEQKTIGAAADQKKLAITDLRAQRDSLKADSPQYAQKNKELLEASIQFEIWGRMTQMDVERQQKQQIKVLYDKIRGAIAEVATRRGIELVIAEQGVDLPADLEQINMDQLKLLINQRNILFNSALVDISPEVITTMDAKYKAGK